MAYFIGDMVPGICLLSARRFPRGKQGYHGAESVCRMASDRTMARSFLDLCPMGDMEFYLSSAGTPSSAGTMEGASLVQTFIYIICCESWMGAVPLRKFLSVWRVFWKPVRHEPEWILQQHGLDVFAGVCSVLDGRRIALNTCFNICERKTFGLLSRNCGDTGKNCAAFMYVNLVFGMSCLPD